MQQKLCSRGSGSSLLPERSGGGGAAVSSSGHHAAVTSSSSSCLLPFRCPRCGEQERFRSLSSLRAHLEHRHPYASHAPPPVLPAVPPSPPPTRTFSITGQIHSSSVGLGQTSVGLGQTHSITGQTHTSAGLQIHSSVLVVPWGELSLPTRRGSGGGGRGAGGGGRGLHVRSLSDCRERGGGASSSSGGGLHRASARVSERRRTQSVGVGTAQDDGEEEEEEEEEDEEEEEEERDQGRYDHHRHRLNFGPPPSDPSPDRPPEAVGGHILYPGGLEGAGSASSAAAAASAAVGRRLAAALRSADTPMQRRLASVSTELARADTQLLCQRAHWRHLARERQEVADRERSLSRQVDVAVMVIAALREQLNASENELERREREVLTIQKFLEAAARQESCGKVRIQRFIENLLKRIALAERLLQYYQDTASPKGPSSPPPQYNHCCKQQPTDNRHHRTSKSRSMATTAAGGPFSSSSGLHDNRSHAPSQFGGCPPFSKPPARGRGEERREREREEEEEEEERSYRQRLAQSSRLFCRPEHRDDIWNPQHQRSATGYEA